MILKEIIIKKFYSFNYLLSSLLVVLFILLGKNLIINKYNFFSENCCSTINIFFEKGEINIKNSDKLNTILECILKDNFKYAVFIKGFASKELIKNTNDNFSNNYEISKARTMNTKNYIIYYNPSLHEKLNFYLSSFSNSNASLNNRESRRVEIIFKRL